MSAKIVQFPYKTIVAKAKFIYGEEKVPVYFTIKEYSDRFELLRYFELIDAYEPVSTFFKETDASLAHWAAIDALEEIQYMKGISNPEIEYLKEVPISG